jgi:hypothetical protein
VGRCNVDVSSCPGDKSGKVVTPSGCLKSSNPEANKPRAPGRLNFLWWRQIFLGPTYEPWSMSPIWRLEFWDGSYIFGEFVHHCSNGPSNPSSQSAQDICSVTGEATPPQALCLCDTARRLYAFTLPNRNWKTLTNLLEQFIQPLKRFKH